MLFYCFTIILFYFIFFVGGWGFGGEGEMGREYIFILVNAGDTFVSIHRNVLFLCSSLSGPIYQRSAVAYEALPCCAIFLLNT